MNRTALRSRLRNLVGLILAFALLLQSTLLAYAAEPPPAESTAQTGAVVTSQQTAVQQSSDQVADIPQDPAADPQFAANDVAAEQATTAASGDASTGQADDGASDHARSGPVAVAQAAAVQQTNRQKTNRHVADGTTEAPPDNGQAASNAADVTQTTTAASGAAISGQPDEAPSGTAQSGSVVSVQAADVQQQNVQVTEAPGDSTQVAANSAAVSQQASATSGIAAAGQVGDGASGTARSGSAVSFSQAVVQQVNIQVIDAPRPKDASSGATQVATNAIANQLGGTQSSGAAAAVGVGGGASGVAQSGTVLSAAVAFIQQINVQLIRVLTGDPPVQQNAENLLVVDQSASAQSGDTTVSALALPVTQLDQQSIQIYTDRQADEPLESPADLIASLLHPLFAAPSNPTSSGASDSKSASAPSASAPSTPSTPDGKNGGGAAQSGSALAAAVALVQQINVQLINGLIGGTPATQNAQNVLVIQQNPQAQSGTAATGADGGFAGSGSAATFSITQIDQQNVQVYDGHAPGSGKSTATLIADLLVPFFDSPIAPAVAAPAGGPGVTQSASNVATITQATSAVSGNASVGVPLPTPSPTPEPTPTTPGDTVIDPTPTPQPTTSPVPAIPPPAQQTPPSNAGTDGSAGADDSPGGDDSRSGDSASSQSGSAEATICRFVLGFKAFHDAYPSLVGDCKTDEYHNPENGDTLQETTRGLLVWRKADNFTAFTDGYRTWVLGPVGLQVRLNTERFPWERDLSAPEVLTQGFSQDGSLVGYSIVLHNRNTDFALVDSALHVVAYDASGQRLGGESAVVKSLGPGQTRVISIVMPVPDGARVERVDARLAAGAFVPAER